MKPNPEKVNRDTQKRSAGQKSKGPDGVIDSGNSGYKRQKIQIEEEDKLPEISQNDNLKLLRDDAESADEEEWPQYGDDDANEWDDYGGEDDVGTPE